MGREIDLLDRLPRFRRPVESRGREATDEIRREARLFGEKYFDGSRIEGYGGYRYDGRWVPVAERLRDHYGLARDAAVLDVGCAKGFLLQDLRTLLPRAALAGLDISTYAIERAAPEIRPLLRTGDARDLPFENGSFDLVLSINTVHNLPREDCGRALREIQRVTRRNAFVTVDAWRTDAEHARLLQWNLTALTYLHVDEWVRFFDEVGYRGDYHWFIP